MPEYIEVLSRCTAYLEVTNAVHVDDTAELFSPRCRLMINKRSNKRRLLMLQELSSFLKDIDTGNAVAGVTQPRFVDERHKNVVFVNRFLDINRFWIRDISDMNAVVVGKKFDELQQCN